MSTVVAGVDFGTLSVRVSLVDSERGQIGSGTSEYPLHRKKEDPDFATQRHADHMSALVLAMSKALAAANVKGEQVAAIALDTTGSSVVPVDKNLEPLDDYYLWCDHRAWKEAAEITDAARTRGVKAIEWCGGVYSSEWGFAKLLHWLRNNPEKRKGFATALEHCDMVAATLTGTKDFAKIPRSVCAMGHKWMWNHAWGGFPDNEFLKAVDPLLDGIAEKMRGRYETSDCVAGTLTADWAEKLGLRAGLPIPVGAFDAHWDTIGAGARLHDMVNVVGTSTCIVGISDSADLVPGVCGVVPGSVHPKFTGIEAGLSATGDIFEAIARRAQVPLAELSKKIENYRAGQTGLLRMTWDNGDRTVLVNPELGGVTLGWKLTHGPEDELFAAMEGTGFHTRVILERMERHGVSIRRVINGGGIPQKNRKLNQMYADILNKPVLVPEGDVTSLGSAIFAFLAAGTFSSIEKAQDALCRKFTVFEPRAKSTAVCEELYLLYRKLYFSLGQKQSPAATIGDVLPELRRISSAAWSAS
jgi:L-ribulokinase